MPSGLILSPKDAKQNKIHSLHLQSHSYSFNRHLWKACFVLGYRGKQKSHSWDRGAGEPLERLPRDLSVATQLCGDVISKGRKEGSRLPGGGASGEKCSPLSLKLWPWLGSDPEGGALLAAALAQSWPPLPMSSWLSGLGSCTVVLAHTTAAIQALMTQCPSFRPGPLPLCRYKAISGECPLAAGQKGL